MKNLTILCLSLFLIFTVSSSQKKFRISGKDIPQLLPHDAAVRTIVEPNTITLISRNSPIVSKKNDDNRTVRIIVEFNETPLFLSSAPQRPVTGYQQRFMEFSSFVTSLAAKVSTARMSKQFSPLFGRTFYKTFFGMSMEIPSALWNDILRHPSVKRIHEDKEMKADLIETVRQVGADSVWSQYGVLGDSIIVGVIDTGIDYFHPALGGDMGPSYRVIGGYDCFNNDGDPFDDNGHGTHVAGIIGADGDSVKGIAPHVRFMAFKVLDKNGYGTESMVMEGIERAADPNNDNDPKDRVDVANMSLGGDGTPDDALATAVNNAVDLGIVFCVSAGNDYTFNSIGSPAGAKNAITVGAVGKDGMIAFFNSKGPSKKEYLMKPEVLAPGVNIISTFKNKSYESMSGTSMASPVAAGICALLKSARRSLTPWMVKSALMTTAHSINKEAMIQGAGIVDAFAAMGRTAFSRPSQLNFGMDSSQFPLWSITDTVWVTNAAGSTQIFNSSSQTIAGVTFSISPAGQSIAPKETKPFIIHCAVDNSIVPYPEQGSLAYDGSLLFNGTIDTLRLPWSFVKATRLRISTKGIPGSLILSNQNISMSEYMMERISFAEFQAVVPRGSYDIFADFGYYGSNRMVFKEQINVEAVTHIEIDPASAVYTVGTRFVDVKGNALLPIGKQHAVCFPESSLFLVSHYSSGGDYIDTLFFSPVSDRFTFAFNEIGTDESNTTTYAPFGSLRGITRDTVISPAPSHYRSAKLLAELPFDAKKHTMTSSIIAYMIFSFPDGSIGMGISNGYQQFNDTASWKNTFHMMQDDNILSGGSFRISRDGVPPYFYEGADPWMDAPLIRVLNDSIICSNSIERSPVETIIPSGALLKFIQSPVFTDAFHLNNYFGRSNIAAGPAFFGQTSELRSFNHSHFSAFTDWGHKFMDDDLIKSSPRDVPPGKYRTEVTFTDYSVGGSSGSALLRSEFDLREQDCLPPAFTSLQLRNALQQPVTGFHKNDSGKLIFTAMDYSLYKNSFDYFSLKSQSVNKDSTGVQYRQHGAAEWIPLPLTIHPFFDNSTTPEIAFIADLSGTTLKDSAAVDLQFRLRDMTGNITTWILSPAYAVSAYRGKPSSVQSTDENGIPSDFTLLQNFPNPFNPETVIRYTVPVQSSVSVSVYDILGKRIAQLVNEDHQPGTYSVEWNGRNQLGEAAASGMYLYRLEANGISRSGKMVLMR
ncbi:MAG: S8 family serine peptidase [Bacteroidetes bacterium]|nr:S8 family serine peptidase [Bacteroidota bacterium]